MKPTPSLFAHCRTLVEKKVDWGDSRRWTQADFEMLSETILAETGISLSPSTLKRLWGRVTYHSTPQASTLNALARFVGYSSYRAFERANAETTSTLEMPTSPLAVDDVVRLPDRPRRFSNSGLWSVGLIMGFILSLILAFSLSRPSEDASLIDPAHYSFSSRPVATGLPNSVVFTFDVSAAPTDCLHIQQSWDERLRFSIRKDQEQATSVYYYPGFFRAKLLVDSVVVKEHDLYIQTNGWLPLVEQSPVPVYFTPEETVQDGTLGLSAAQLRGRHIALQPEVPWVSYYYVQDMGGLSSRNFSLESRLKNTFSLGSEGCQNSAMAIPLSIPGCTSAINAFFAGTLLKGTETDLSALGADFADWVTVRLTVEDQQVEVFVNGRPALQTSFSQAAGKVIGIVYRFQGTGLVDYLHLYDAAGEAIFSEEF